MNYFRFVAQECREIMAQLGVRGIADLIGHTELLEIQRRARPRGSGGSTSTPTAVDRRARRTTSRSSASMRATRPSTRASWPSGWWTTCARRSSSASGGRFGYEIAQLSTAPSARASPARSRAAGATTAWRTRRSSCDCTAPPDRASASGMPAACTCISKATPTTTSARAWRAARSCCGRRERELRRTSDTVIMGNTCLYGATGGELYAAGHAGERFAVRNSGAHRGGRRRRRSLLRIHDRRRGVRARAHRAQLRRRLHRRLRLRARPRSRFRRSLQPRADRHPPHHAGGHGDAPAAPAAPDRAACARDRQRLGRRRS